MMSEENLEDREFVLAQLTKYANSYGGIRTAVKALEKQVNQLNRMIAERRKRFDLIRGSVSRTVKIHFAVRLNTR